MRLLGELGGIEDDELRATFNGGLGMVVVVPPRSAERTVELAGGARRSPAWVVGEVVDGAPSSAAPVRGGRDGVTRRAAGHGSPSACPGAGRTCGRSSRPRLAARSGGEVALVFADRACPALDWAAEQGIETALVPGGDDATLRGDARRGRARRRGPRGLPAARRAGGPGARSTAGSSTSTRRCCRRSRGSTPCATRSPPAWRSPASPSTSSTRRSTAARSWPRRPSRSCPATTRRRSLERLHAVEHRLLPRRSPRLLAGALGRAGRRATFDPAAFDAACPCPRRALLSVSDKAGPRRARRGPRRARLRARQHRRHGPRAARGRPAGHRRRRGHRLPRDARRAREDAPPARSTPASSPTGGAPTTARRSPPPGIAPFELVVVNLYPFAEAARKPGPRRSTSWSRRSTSAGRRWSARRPRTTPRVAIVTSPARYDGVLAALDEHGAIPLGLRSALAVEAFAPHRRVRRPDRRRAAVPHARRRRRPAARAGLPGAEDPYPPVLTISMAKVETLRYGENPHQPAARYRRTDREPRPAEGPFASGEPPLQGKALSYNNVLDASAAAVAGPAPARPRRRHRQAHQPVRRGRARRRCSRPGTPRSPATRCRRSAAWSRSPGTVDRDARRAADVAVPRGRRRARLRRGGARGPRRPSPTCAWSWTRRSTRRRPQRPDGRGLLEVDYLGSVRTAGGAVLVTAPDRQPDDPDAWAQRLDPRAPTDAERARPRPRLAPVPGRRLERDRPRPGRHAGRARLGAGQPRRRLPPGRRQGAPVPGRGRGARRGRGVGRVLPVRRRPGAAARRPA